MSVSKRFLRNEDLCGEAANLYRTTYMTMEEIGAKFGVTHATASHAIRKLIPKEERSRLKIVRYSRSKAGRKNPQHGVKRAAEAILKNGYLASWNNDRKDYDFIHRQVFAKHLGVDRLPDDLFVHHIDGDKHNNNINNLALVTKSGHQRLHKQLLGRLYEWEKEKFGTSLLMEMHRTARKD